MFDEEQDGIAIRGMLSLSGTERIFLKGPGTEVVGVDSSMVGSVCSVVEDPAFLIQ